MSRLWFRIMVEYPSTTTRNILWHLRNQAWTGLIHMMATFVADDQVAATIQG
jgi:hypothetical protein